MPVITLELNESEQQAFQQMIDLSLKQNGLGALNFATHFVQKIAQAYEAAKSLPQTPAQPAEAPPQE